MFRLILATTVLVASLFLQVGVASAFPPDVQKIYDAAKVDLKENRSFQALEKFRQCLDLVRGDDESTWNLLMAVSLTYEQMGQLDHAVEYYRRFLSETDERATTLEEKWQMRREKVVANIRRHEQEILALRGLVEIRSLPKGAEISVDGRAVGADGVGKTPFIAYVKPGTRSVKLRINGYLDFEKMVDVTVGSRQRVDFKLVKKKRAAAKKGKKRKMKKPKNAKEKALAGATRVEKVEESSQVLPWVAIGSGVGLMGAGYFFHSQAQGAADDIRAKPDGDDSGYDDLKGDIELNNMLLGAAVATGVVATGLGVYLLSSGSGDKKTAKASAHDGRVPSVVVSPWQGGAYVQTGWGW